MAITFTNISPVTGSIGAELNTEIVFNLVSDGPAINLSTLIVDINSGVNQERAIENGSFVYNFTGEIIDNSLGALTDITIVIIRPISNPEYFQGKQINVVIDIEIYNFSTYFTTKTYQFVIPSSYTEILDLTSLPSGYTLQTSGTGTPPTFGIGGMTTFPNAAGTSFIKKNAAGLDFNNGVLFDLIIEPGIAAIKRTKVLRLCRNDQGLVSVVVDFTNNEIWIEDVLGVPQETFRPVVKGDELFFRLSVKGSNENLVARLYSSENILIDIPLLKQTAGPADQLPICINAIDIGSVESGDADIIIKNVNIILDENPDIYYPFPNISRISPDSDVLAGGDTLKIEFTPEIDAGAGSSILIGENEFLDESTGGGSVTLSNRNLLLNVNGVGSAAAKMIRSFSGDRPSGSDIYSYFEVPSALISKPPQTETILAGIEFKSNGDILQIQFVSSTLRRTTFRVKLFNSGVLVLDKYALTSSKSSFYMRLIRSINRIQALVDSSVVIDSPFKDGPGILKYYAEAATSLNFQSKVTEISVLPVIMIGDTVVNA